MLISLIIHLFTLVNIRLSLHRNNNSQLKQFYFEKKKYTSNILRARMNEIINILSKYMSKNMRSVKYFNQTCR